MTCDVCGAGCQGSRCADCRREEGAEAVHGDVNVVPPYRQEEDDGQWVQKQQGIGGQPEGQATLDRDLVTDGGER